MKTIFLATAAGFGAGLLLWTADAYLGSRVFNEGPFWTMFWFGSHAHSLFLRAVLLLSFTLFGLTIGIFQQRRQRTEQALRKNEQENRWLIDHAADAIFVTDPEGTFLDVNEKACAMLGYTRAELLQLDIRALTLPEEVAKRPFQLAALRAGQTVRTERTLLRKDGSRLSVEVNGQMLPDRRLGAIVRDMTERKQVEQALRQSESRFRAIFEESTIGISVADDDGRFLAVNQAMADMLGYEIDELLGMTFMDVTHPDDLAVDLENIAERRAGRVKRLQIEKRYVRKDNTVIWVNLRVVPFPHADTSRAATIGIAVDITERRQVAQALQRALRAYHVLSDCNQALVRATDEMGLMQQICHILVHVGGFRLAWVGFVQQGNGQTITPVSHDGHDGGYLDKLQISLQDDAGAATAMGAALLAGKSVLVRDIAADHAYEPGPQAAAALGFRSSISLPLLSNDILFGSLNIYANETNAFDGTEVRLLEELAGDLTLGITLLRNENARRQSEAALRSSELRFRGFFDNNAVPMAIISTDGYVVEANEANVPFLQYSLDELIGMHFTDLTYSEDVTLDAGLFQSLLRGELEEYTIDKRYVRQDGQVVWGRLSVAAIRDEEGSVRYTAIVCQDITERKQVQEALLQLTQDLEKRVAARTAELAARSAELAARSAELAAANERLQQLTEVKDKFVENVSHELRTPITNIKLYHDLMQRRPERVQTYLERMNREIDRLAGLIEDLLMLSRLDQIERPLATTAVSLNELLQPLVADRWPLAEDENLQLSFTAAATLPQVQVDPELIGKAIGTLLTNAITYTPPGGQVTVSTFFDAAASQVGIHIQDTGPGVAPEEQAQIFERFYRGQAGRSSGAAGTGLGLAIVQEIARLHNGNVTVSSDRANGATFTLWLPVS